MDAIFFVLRTGCQWNAWQDTGLCFSSSAPRRCQEWAAAGVFLAFWEQGLAVYAALQVIDWEWLAMDGAMTKAPWGGKRWARIRPTAGSSGPSGACSPDGCGVPIGLAVEGANRNDFKMVEAPMMSIPIERPAPTQAQPPGLCLDKGYDDDEVRELLAEFEFTAHIRARGEEAQAIKREAGYKARRWVVERTHSWMNRCRRILIRWDKNVRNYLAFLHLACASITYRQSGLLG
jgi:transposase